MDDPSDIVGVKSEFQGMNLDCVSHTLIDSLSFETDLQHFVLSFGREKCALRDDILSCDKGGFIAQFYVHSRQLILSNRVSDNYLYKDAQYSADDEVN